MPATVLFLECKSYVIVGIYTSISEFPLMCGDVRLMCGDVWWCAVMCGFQALPTVRVMVQNHEQNIKCSRYKKVCDSHSQSPRSILYNLVASFSPLFPPLQLLEYLPHFNILWNLVRGTPTISHDTNDITIQSSDFPVSSLSLFSDGHQLLKKQFNYNYFFNYLVVVKLSS